MCSGITLVLILISLMTNDVTVVLLWLEGRMLGEAEVLSVLFRARGAQKCWLNFGWKNQKVEAPGGAETRGNIGSGCQHDISETGCILVDIRED